MIRKTPAVTRVEECTRAETGVGAAMAAGSHLENGTCALFVMAAMVINKVISCENGVDHMLVIFQCPWFNLQAIEINNITSPIRLLRAVIIPAARDLGF